MQSIEWSTTTSPKAMLGHMRRLAGESWPQPWVRKLRLWTCAVVRRGWDYLEDQRSRDAVEAVESFCDGGKDCLDWPELREVRAFALLAFQGTTDDIQAMWAARAYMLGQPDLKTLARNVVSWDNGRQSGIARLLRDVIGDPHDPEPFVPAGARTPTVASLAEDAYSRYHRESGALDKQRLFILADAMEEAGWAQYMTDHLRSTVHYHVRGCWALDLALEKERE